jgi:hypothetical protein
LKNGACRGISPSRSQPPAAVRVRPRPPLAPDCPAARAAAARAMGRIIDTIFYSEMLVVFYLFIIDPILSVARCSLPPPQNCDTLGMHLVRRHDGVLPLLSAVSSRLQNRCCRSALAPDIRFYFPRSPSLAVCPPSPSPRPCAPSGRSARRWQSTTMPACSLRAAAAATSQSKWGTGA